MAAWLGAGQVVHKCMWLPAAAPACNVLLQCQTVSGQWIMQGKVKDVDEEEEEEEEEEEQEQEEEEENFSLFNWTIKTEEFPT